MNTAFSGSVRLHEEPFTLYGIDYRDGLYLVTLDKELNEILQYVGDPLWVTASGRDPSGLGWGVQVKCTAPTAGLRRPSSRGACCLVKDGRHSPG